MDSDIDLVVLVNDPQSFRRVIEWLEEIVWPAPVVKWADVSYGSLWSRHCELEGHARVELGFCSREWASCSPLDPGTARVIRDGCRILYDPLSLFERLCTEVAQQGEVLGNLGTDSHRAEASIDLSEVRTALRTELVARGCEVASDTVGAKLDLYVLGAGDLARALFEFKSGAREAFETMYQGSWVADLPPRFAVLPGSEDGNSELEMLEQARIGVLFFDRSELGIAFRDLDSVMHSVG